MPEVKKLLFDRFLRKNGKEDSPIVELDGLELQIFAGQKVDTGAKDPVTEMIGGNPVTWVFVSAKDGVDANAKKGFVVARDLVDEGVEVLTSGGYVPFPKEVEKAAFADACFVHAELNRTNPAYLYALAFVQSGDRWSETSVKTDDPADAVALGAYRFTREAWTKFLALPELAGLTVESIASPTAQCVVAGVLAAKSATLLKGLITDHGLSAIDLCLAHIFNDDGTFGSSAADKMLQAEKADPTQPSLNVIKKVYDDDAARTASLKRNKAIFKEDGSATIKEAIQTCVDKFTAAFEEVKKLAHEIEKSVPSDADNPIFGIQFSGKMVSITDQDVDALARVGESEVGNFDEKFGVQMFTDAIGAVIDTVFNRMIYPSTEFPKTIQGVINQPKQFSAINDLGTWEKLPKPSDKHFQIALHHIQNRARGTASQIKGATHFFNPTSHPSWGEPIRARPIASYGVPPDSHIHGFPANYHPPEGHAIQLGQDAWVFSGDGQPQGPLISPDKSASAIVAAATKEWEFWGRSVPGNVGHVDNEVPFATYVRDTYCKLLGARPSLEDIEKDVYFWSAVTISYMIRQAGIQAPAFTISQMHCTYIREAIKAQQQQDASKAYWGFRLKDKEAVVAVGDIIGAGRTRGMSFDEAQALFDRTDDYESHSDIVVAVRPGEADLIGGNVSDSVTKKTIALDTKGKVKDRQNLSFVVMKKR
ncbi:DUF2272 domain-containing protein [Bradyrhizobium diazoefficiens]|nr:DUF2272 domain-containing protein [Bradyrhizobium diazoefficiens]MBR0810254.1 DUF2272 domain-containing protein [Bradyrhizobium diazoefficiens]